MTNQVVKLRYLRIAPRKVRLVANTIKGLSVSEAEAQLLVNPKRASAFLLKLLRSAMANIKNNQKLDARFFLVKEVRVDEGPAMKRFMPRAMGRATLIKKKSSHIILVLEESDKLKIREPRFQIKKVENISEQKIQENIIEKSKEGEKKDKDYGIKNKDSEHLLKGGFVPGAKKGQQDGAIRTFFRRKVV
jgi:large subunit ribosomal protein L22